jgi:lysozyme
MVRRKRRNTLILLTATFLVALGLFYACNTQPPRIPDKVEVRIYQRAQKDSQQVADQLREMDYYMRTHDVTDEGYNLIAQYHTLLSRMAQTAGTSSISSKSGTSGHPGTTTKTVTVRIAAKDRLLPAVRIAGGYWKAGHFHMGRVNGPVILRDSLGRIVCAEYDADTIVKAVRTDSLGTYRGQMDRRLQAWGQGTYDALDGSHYEGFWEDDQRCGFGFESSTSHVRVGTWKKGRFLGEKLRYTAERIYGIDISRHQHEKGRKRFGINWKQLRITSLGHRHPTDGQTFPVSFVYIKSTEGTTIRNRYFMSDYTKAKKQGLHVGAYHFFSLKTPALAQATYFVNSTLFREGDFPPVLDVEPTDAQINAIGGDEVLMQRIRTFMEYVERRTHMRPILYVNQMFINKHMQHAADIKQNYNVWIARYGEYKPDVKLVYWQLSPEGRVSGITGPVDINVFNGYQGQWDEFLRTGFHQ